MRVYKHKYYTLMNSGIPLERMLGHILKVYSWVDQP